MKKPQMADSLHQPRDGVKADTSVACFKIFWTLLWTYLFFLFSTKYFVADILNSSAKLSTAKTVAQFLGFIIDWAIRCYLKGSFNSNPLACNSLNNGEIDNFRNIFAISRPVEGLATWNHFYKILTFGVISNAVMI